jgi:hypothetical protein
VHTAPPVYYEQPKIHPPPIYIEPPQIQHPETYRSYKEQIPTTIYPHSQVLVHNNVNISVTNLSPTTALMFIPQDQFPKYNFVGKLIGPSGRTLQLLEKNTKWYVHKEIFLTF